MIRLLMVPRHVLRYFRDIWGICLARVGVPRDVLVLIFL